VFAFKLGQVANHPLIDAVGKQQNFNTLLAEDFEMRAVFCSVEGIGSDEIDLLLPPSSRAI
jgi:hypothetical protein